MIFLGINDFVAQHCGLGTSLALSGPRRAAPLRSHVRPAADGRVLLLLRLLYRLLRRGVHPRRLRARVPGRRAEDGPEETRVPKCLDQVS